MAIVCLGLILIAVPAARGEDENAPMPLATTERLWQDPGPEQSGPGAPRLLIVNPRHAMTSFDADAQTTRYAGRVEPATATVTLNGSPLTVYPGGVFIGTRDLDGGAETTWRFEATAEGKKTTVERTLRREPRPEPAPSWPLSFFAAPVSPTGDAWMRPGDTLKVTLYASSGRRAQVKIGSQGAWRDMTEGAPSPTRGGVYTAVLDAPRQAERPRLQAVIFCLSGSAGGPAQSRELTSGLRLATIPADRQLWGHVTANLATFLKNGDASNWERHGNFVRGTPFRVLYGRGERVYTSFGHGERGWLENISIALDETFQDRSLPALSKPALTRERQSLILAWPAVTHPIACVFYPSGDEGEAVLRISLPGAANIKNFSASFTNGPFKSVEGRDGLGGKAPVLTVRLGRPLWGYAMLCDAEKGLRIIMRARPRVGGAPGKDLAGLRVMLDAGHGGDSPGAAGPSGLLEKDINLVQAAWLEKDLEALGAEVRQVRRGDTASDLDERVDMALAWLPDLFISLHHNSVGDGQDPLSDSGPMAFYHYPQSRGLAQAIAGRLAALLVAEKGPRARASVFRVNRNISFCPSVLTESGFICNPRDEAKLRRAETLKLEAQAVAEGVRIFFAGE